MAVAQSRPAQIMYDPLFCRRERPLQGPSGGSTGHLQAHGQEKSVRTVRPVRPTSPGPQGPRRSQEPWRNLAVL